LHIEELVRKFLAVQYAEVCNVLKENNDLLNAVAERMLWDPVVDQFELKEIWRQVEASRPRAKNGPRKKIANSVR
jgi:ATP-dependent Zn protease